MDDKLDDLVKQEMNHAIGLDGSPLFDLNAPEGRAPEGPALQTHEDPGYELIETALPDVRDATTRDLLERRAALKLNIENLDEDRDNRLTEIAPANGWGGANDSTRKLSREKAALEDEVCNQIGVLSVIKRREMAAIDAALEIRDLARRATDQDIRKREADQRDVELALRRKEVALQIAKLDAYQLREFNKQTLPF